MPIVDVSSEQFFYLERGQGMPVVFIHGAGSSHLIWGAQLRGVGEIARAIALDLPGHGRSSGPARQTIEGYAEAVLLFLDALRLERVVVVGHSMGGAIAQTLALSHPDRLAALVLVSTGARLRVRPDLIDSEPAGFGKVLASVTQDAFAAGVDPALVSKTLAQLLACDPQVVRGDYRACDAFDVMERMGEIRAPTLVVCGVEDRMTPPKYSEFLAAKIPHARLEWIDRAGHNVMLEQPQAVNRALVEFVKEVV